ncbi:FtsX-like permease family protein [Actinoplanes sp. NPDC024001]|uniref:FtsX-like permease family protein n=1 Tax=Actinoplanes sp. NPDC024001 TaxID=3154598 RepID=UPI0033F4AC9C
MISLALALAQVWARRGQAVTLALLAMLAVASAVAAPAYLLVADRAVAAGQIATAGPGELSLVARGARDADAAADDGTGIDFTDVGHALIDMDGFSYVYSAEMPTVGLERATTYPTRFVFRQDVCAHVRILSGRCLAGEGDVLLGERTAQRLGLAAGDGIVLSGARLNGDPVPKYVAAAPPKTLSVAGIYRPLEPAGAYWGTHGYFISGPDVGSGEPVFTNSLTLSATRQTVTTMAIDGIANPGTFDIHRLDQVEADLRRVEEVSREVGAVQINTGMPRLFERIEEGRAEARLLVPVLAVPLVLLACFSIYLTVGHGAEARQNELAVVALRGTRWWTRWWLATGESLAAVLAGALAGCLAGQLLINAVAASLFPGVGADAGWASLRYAPVAAAAALLAAVAALRRQLFSPVATLLRRTPPERRRLQATEAVVLVLAIVAGGQLALSDGSLTGVGLFAPALLMLALALLTAHALLPLVGRYATRALNRGRIGVALAGLQLSRRPGATRLFALLAATAAVAAYATCAVDTAARGRAVQAELGTGADRVLTVEAVPRRRLLAAVREVDPQGAFAMAVTNLYSGGSRPRPGLAVDSPRLAAVATWPEDAPSAAEVARRLRVAGTERPEFTGTDIVVEATKVPTGPDAELRLIAAVSSVRGLGESVVEFGEMSAGRRAYQQRVAICRDGCRISGVGIVGGTTSEVTGRVVVHELRAAAPAGDATPIRFTEQDRWWGSHRTRTSAAPDGIAADVEVSSGAAGAAWIRPVSAPAPVPMAHAGPLPEANVISTLGGDAVPVVSVASLPAVPVLGRTGTLVDLELADQLTVDEARAQQPQVWLNAAAPADIVERLAKQGLTVIGDTRAGQVRERLDRQGPAIALWFHVLAGVLTVLLGAGALVLTIAVDRARRAEDLTALRVQGLRPGQAAQATFWTFPVLVTIAAVVGLGAGVAGWLLTGWALPLAGLEPPDLPLPGLPRVPVLLGVGGAVLVLYLVAALGVTRRR